MVKQLFTSACLLFLFSMPAFAQEDPVLFTVKGNPVRVSEFKYIYSKTNQDKADFSKNSLEEYLDLYSKFKLKVQKARDLQIDTVGSLKNELEGYRRQLANSYLVDKEVTEKLVRETYERMQQDVDISYIFIACDRNAPAKDSLRAYNRAMGLLKMIQGGASFEKIAVDSSEDKSAKENKGALGYVTAMLPDGYYLMEKAVYAAKPGALLGPVRSSNGYSVVRVNGFRPARGEMEVAQILIRKADKKDRPERELMSMAKQRADSVYLALKNGASWETTCTKYSDDKMTAPKGGYIGFFGINRYQRSFEDAAFALQKDGDFTAPVETSIGYHIIKRITYRPVGAFETIKRALTERVKRDSRSDVAKQAMIARIRKENFFQESADALSKWTAMQHDSLFHTYRWKPDPTSPKTVLFRFGNSKEYTVADFEEYCARASRDRMRGKGYPVEETVGKLYKAWTDDCTMQYEETQLDKKYPDFKALMREYEEGMMLFEVAKQQVWDRANTDTLGLEKFFNENLKTKFKWDERARVSIYTLKSDDPKLLEKLRKYAAKKPAADVLKKFNKKGEVLTVLEKTYEKGKNKDLNNIWSAGAMTEAKTDAGTKTANFIKVEEIIGPTPKTLSEARGYAVAEYQDFLEKQWVEDLRKEYKVEINQQALNALVRRP